MTPDEQVRGQLLGCLERVQSDLEADKKHSAAVMVEQAREMIEAQAIKLVAVEAECADRAADVAFYKSSAERSALDAAVAADALSRHGYRKSCDIPACNCGDQWNHGGHAVERLRELADVLYENGKTPLAVAKELVERVEATETRLDSLRRAVREFASCLEAWEGVSMDYYMRQMGSPDDLRAVIQEIEDEDPDVEDQRPCTCHPDDNPPRPCPRKFALEECRAAAVERRDRFND